MSDIIKLAAVFVGIVFMMRAKLKVGYALLLGALGLSLMYLMSPLAMAHTVYGAINDMVTLKLLLALTLIRMFEMQLRERSVMAEMTDSVKALFSSRKAVTVSMPFLIGMLPSVGGAYFSAPMVEASTRDTGMQPEEKAFVNYWYRHPWEIILPLYPGLILATNLGNIPLREMILLNMPFSLAMFALGFLVSMRGMDRQVVQGGQGAAPHAAPDAAPDAAKPSYKSFLPIAFVLMLVAVFGIELFVALVLAVFTLALYFRMPLAEIWKMIRYGVSGEVVFLILGVMLFKETMEATGAVGNISAYFISSGIPIMPTLMLLPFMVGLLTGLNVGFVSATFPLLLNLPGGSEPYALSFAFLSGYVGVLLSPVHVCFVLTRDYFKADLGGIYRRMALPLIALWALIALQYLILTRLM